MNINDLPTRLEAATGPDRGLDAAQRGPIIKVIFVHESGYVESYTPAEIRDNPDIFQAILEEHRVAGRKPLALRGALRAREASNG